jgi:acetyl esterase/lipase
VSQGAIAPTNDGRDRPRRPLSLNIVARGLLVALTSLTLLPAAFAVVGGLFPRLPVVGPFGLILNTGWPWILGDLVASACFGGIAVLLGGRKAKALLAVILVVLGGAAFVGYRYMSFAAEHGGSYDVVRALDGFPPIAHADSEVVFATVDGSRLKAELWFPEGATDARPASLPAVVFVHGGAFQAGFPGTRPLLLEALDRAGVVGIDVDYRLAPPPRWDQAPSDVLCALAWLRTAHEVPMVDPRRVVIVGESAGGSLALVAGYAAGTTAIASSCPELGPPVVPAGILAIAPTADLEGIWQDATIADLSGSRFPEAYIGGSPVQFPQRYSAAEPFRLLRPELPRTLILAGEIDRLVRVDRLISFAGQIRAAGASVELLVAPFAGHGFDGEPNSFGDQLVETLVPAFVREVTG